LRFTSTRFTRIPERL